MTSASGTCALVGSGRPGLVSHSELEQAWRAIQAGRFRGPADGTGRADGWDAPGVVVAVVGAHGWSGASTAALMIAEGCARQGVPVRVVDAAAPARSGFAAAAATEHGVDESGQWRVGHRGPVAVHRLVTPVGRVVDVPVPESADSAGVSVVDVGWPATDLLECRQERHWLGLLLRDAPVALTARATVPGLRHAEGCLQALAASSRPVCVLLVGVKRLPRWLLAAAGPRVLAAHGAGLLVTVPSRPELAGPGLTPAPLPRQLTTAGDRLVHLTVDRFRESPQPVTDPGMTNDREELG